MSNRLEQAFPRIHRQATARLGPAGVSPEIVQQHIERGRQLRSQALCDSARAMVRAPLLLTSLVRRIARNAVRRPFAREGWGSPAHGA